MADNTDLYFGAGSGKSMKHWFTVNMGLQVPIAHIVVLKNPKRAFTNVQVRLADSLIDSGGKSILTTDEDITEGVKCDSDNPNDINIETFDCNGSSGKFIIFQQLEKDPLNINEIYAFKQA